MYDGYLKLGNVEVMNRARTAKYVTDHTSNIAVKCLDEELPVALGHLPYTDPETDGAPWWKGARLATARFFGLYPGKIEGAENSTRGVTVSELSGDGAVMTAPRYGSAELRVVATAFAADEEAMHEGISWLRDVLANDGCSDADLGCTGRTAELFAALPGDYVDAYGLIRSFYRVEVTEGPLVTRKFNSKYAVMWQIEFTLTAGIPWAFTSLDPVAELNMDNGTNFQDPAGEDCSTAVNAYDNFVADPYFTAISRPPRPPVILPPNLLNITSWRRLIVGLPEAQTVRWGRTIPIVHVLTGAEDAQYIRMRFYRDGFNGCDYDGEFLISYIPANCTLSLNGITREATLTLPDGRVVAAGHLLFGSAGRPFIWPTLGCQYKYAMTADLMPGQPGVVITLDTAVRE